MKFRLNKQLPAVIVGIELQKTVKYKRGHLDFVLVVCKEKNSYRIHIKIRCIKALVSSIYTENLWFILAKIYSLDVFLPFWHILTHFDTFTHLDTYWPLKICCNKLRFNVFVFWCILMCFEAFWHVSTFFTNKKPLKPFSSLK